VIVRLLPYGPMSGAQNQIDLSQLPPPNVIEAVTYAQVLTAMKADLLALIPTYDVENEADPAVKILEIAAYREYLLRERINNAARGLMLAYATGSDLDHLRSNLRLTRFIGETDSEFRSRIQLAPDGYSVAGPEAA
jgi:phage-related baseplate assembly protein